MHSGIDHYQDLAPDTVVFSRYRVLRRLGSGRLGVVYACRDLFEVEKIFALKVMNREAMHDRRLRDRFRSEIHASYRISHPNVVRGFEFFRNDHCEAYTMEYVEGRELCEFIPPKTYMRIEGIVELLKDLLLGLEAIHGAQMVHRDLKPKNILVTDEHQVKITDFSTAFTTEDLDKSHAHGAVGTDDYMSPEVIIKGEADYRSDIFSVGVITYQMITGKLPFPRAPWQELGRLRTSHKITPPAKLRPDCPPALNQLVMKTLHKKAEKRFQSAKALRQALEMLDYSSKASWLDRVFGAM